MVKYGIRINNNVYGSRTQAVQRGPGPCPCKGARYALCVCIVQCSDHVVVPCWPAGTIGHAPRMYYISSSIICI